MIMSVLGFECALDFRHFVLFDLGDAQSTVVTNAKADRVNFARAHLIWRSQYQMCHMPNPQKSQRNPKELRYVQPDSHTFPDGPRTGPLTAPGRGVQKTHPWLVGQAFFGGFSILFFRFS
jgi:hypothetical protein